MAMVCLTDFEEYAKEHLSKATWDYYAAGADECCTRDDNLQAYKRIRLRPRFLRDVSLSDIRTTIQGTEISFPVGIAPTAFHRLACHDGEVATARAAEAFNTCYITSTYSTCSVEEIVAAAPNGYRWFQLYVYRDRKVSEQIVHRVEALGYKALVLTVDVPYTGKRRDDIRNQFKLPPHLRVKNFDGVFQIDALSEIVDTVQGRVEIYLDGGIRTGNDVLKALALGAKCVFIGRPAVWGLAYKGEEGLKEVLQILSAEFCLSMALSGCRNVREINRNLVQLSKL
ncbi:hydroxyacid oxidase 2-like isoform X2 [Thalassophryne amazonica]|uniref:hydroxyacid oxidase 2-like isoform X2 n=1 Tax=Thalassophryne amazonica TaxID=390379 RepID=UPI0014709B1B|nr:hydroxyacid oxidase 2-like isoform X2 [Thalassophryne amazonica]